MTGIKSKPQYAELVFDKDAAHHVLAAEGEGAKALVRVWNRSTEVNSTESADGEAEEAPAKIEMLYLREADQAAAERAPQAGPHMDCYDDFDALQSALAERLSNARMGTRLYLAGSEAFIWSLVRIARDAGMDEDEIQRERCATLARPVQCVHCKAVAPAVTTNVYTCPACGQSVFVRDHFSRRLGVYQSVRVDAEAPGDIPQIEEVYP